MTYEFCEPSPDSHTATTPAYWRAARAGQFILSILPDTPTLVKQASIIEDFHPLPGSEPGAPADHPLYIDTMDRLPDTSARLFDVRNTIGVMRFIVGDTTGFVADLRHTPLLDRRNMCHSPENYDVEAAETNEELKSELLIGAIFTDPFTGLHDLRSPHRADLLPEVPKLMKFVDDARRQAGSFPAIRPTAAVFSDPLA